MEIGQLLLSRGWTPERYQDMINKTTGKVTESVTNKYKQNLEALTSAVQQQQPSYSSTLPNTLATNATKSASEITQDVVQSNKPNTELPALNMYLGIDAPSTTGTTTTPTPTAPKTSVYKGQVQASWDAAAAHNAVANPAPNPMDAIMSAYTDALRAGSAQAMQNQRDAVAAAFQGNLIQNQLNKNLTDLISTSQAQAQQSADILNKTLSTLSSGNKGAQTGLEAVDVSEQMAKEDAKRRNLRQTSAADTKKAGLLSQKAMLSKPTLLGV